ncbi:unnamed protein product, partial [Polarella glacialis]
VPAPSFERCVLQAHDRAFEEQRFAPMLWEVLFTKLPDKSTKNRVYNAVEAARKEAAISGTSNGGNPVEEFTSAWLGFSIQKLRAECGAMLESVLPPHVAAEIFHGLIQAGSLPVGLTTEYGPPPDGWAHVELALQDAYSGEFLPPNKGARSVKGQKGAGKTAENSYGSVAKGGAAESKAAPPQPAAEEVEVKGKGGKGNADYYKRPAAEEWGSEDKRPRLGQQDISAVRGGGRMGKGGGKAAAPAAVTAKHSLCTQQEDCIGNNKSALFQHLDGNVPGDIYCASCWAVFADSDPSLE